jgi:hypothetical protein
MPSTLLDGRAMVEEIRAALNVRARRLLARDATRR